MKANNRLYVIIFLIIISLDSQESDIAKLIKAKCASCHGPDLKGLGGVFPNLGEHGWFDKRFMYEESYRTPLLVRWPGMVKAGTRNADLVQNIDFAATFLDMAKADIPDDMQGKSLVSLMKGKTPADWRSSLYYRYYQYPGTHSAGVMKVSRQKGTN